MATVTVFRVKRRRDDGGVDTLRTAGAAAL
jgi:hypothetical protein